MSMCIIVAVFSSVTCMNLFSIYLTVCNFIFVATIIGEALKDLCPKRSLWLSSTLQLYCSKRLCNLKQRTKQTCSELQSPVSFNCGYIKHKSSGIQQKHTGKTLKRVTSFEASQTTGNANVLFLTGGLILSDVWNLNGKETSV